MTVDTDISVRLIGVLRDAAGMPGLEYERRPEPMRGGFWADIFSFSLANPPDGWPPELIARLMPDPGPAGSTRARPGRAPGIRGWYWGLRSPGGSPP